MVLERVGQFISGNVGRAFMGCCVSLGRAAPEITGEGAGRMSGQATENGESKFRASPLYLNTRKLHLRCQGSQERGPVLGKW